MIPVWKSVCFFTCTCLFFGICTVNGFIDDATCISGIVLPIIGCMFGCVSIPFFLNLAVEQSNMAVNTVNAEVEHNRIAINAVEVQDQQANGHDEQSVYPLIHQTNE